MYAWALTHIRLFAVPWTVAHEAPLSMGFSRQEYWSGVPLPSPKLHFCSLIIKRRLLTKITYLTGLEYRLPDTHTRI